VINRLRYAKMSPFIGGRRLVPPSRFRLGVFPLSLRRVEGAHLRLLAEGRLVCDGGRLRF